MPLFTDATDKDFFFDGYDRFQVVKIIAEEFPIGLPTSFDKIIQRTHLRCPYASQTQITKVAKVMFEIMRELLILGERFHLGDLIYQIKLYVSKRTMPDHRAEYAFQCTTRTRKDI